MKENYISTGLNTLDEYLGGWHNGELIVIGSRPTMGKTGLVISMVKKLAIEKNVPCALFSLEMSSTKVVNRLIANYLGLSTSELKDNVSIEDNKERVDACVKKIHDAPLYVDDSPCLSASELRKKATELVGEKNVKLIYVDYVQLMNGIGENREDQLKDIASVLKETAKELNVPIVVMSQLNHEIISADVKDEDVLEMTRPHLSEMRQTAFMQNADMICFLHRPEYHKRVWEIYGEKYKGIAEIIIAKCATAEPGIIQIGFEEKSINFFDIN